MVKPRRIRIRQVGAQDLLNEVNWSRSLPSNLDNSSVRIWVAPNKVGYWAMQIIDEGGRISYFDPRARKLDRGDNYPLADAIRLWDNVVRFNERLPSLWRNNEDGRGYNDP